MRPGNAVYMPAAHDMQLVAFVIVLNVPALHPGHKGVPKPVVYVPIGHTIQFVVTPSE